MMIMRMMKTIRKIMMRRMKMMMKSSQVAMGRRSQLSVYGSDWDTEDGTGECIVFVFVF